MLPTPEIIESRKKVALLIRECLYGKLIVREALKQWPECKDDHTLLCAKHALIHFEADKELFEKDPDYKDQQIDWLEQLINILSEGDAIPGNIIESYEEYYAMPISLKSKIVNFAVFIIYSVTTKVKGILKRFKQ